MKSCPRSPQISAFLDLQILFLKAFPSRLGNCVFDLIRAKFRWYNIEKAFPSRLENTVFLFKCGKIQGV